jgi:hypothetical protein
MATPKKFLLEFMDVTKNERNQIIRYIKDPINKDLANQNNNLHCAVISLFFHKKG